MEAYAKRLGVGGYHIPANRTTTQHFFPWLDARLATWRKAHKAPAPTKGPPRAALPQILRKEGPKRPAFQTDFSSLLVDADDGVRAQAAEIIVGAKPRWAARFVPALCGMLELELPRKRNTNLGITLQALALAQTTDALSALVGLDKRTFGVPVYRWHWLSALATYRSPVAKRILRRHARSAVVAEMIAANAGLVRNGDRAALGRLRHALEDESFDTAQNVACELHLLLKTRFVANEDDLTRFIRWWDTHPTKYSVASTHSSDDERSGQLTAAPDAGPDVILCLEGRKIAARQLVREWSSETSVRASSYRSSSTVKTPTPLPTPCPCSAKIAVPSMDSTPSSSLSRRHSTAGFAFIDGAYLTTALVALVRQ